MAISEDGIYIQDYHLLPHLKLQAHHCANETMVLHLHARLAEDEKNEMYDDHEQSERSEKNEEAEVPWTAKQARDYLQNGCVHRPIDILVLTLVFSPILLN